MAVIITGGWLIGSLPDDTGREWPVVQRRQTSARGPLKAGTPNLILHTTETDHFVQQLRFPSQWQCGDGQIGQHIELGFAGDAVNDHDLEAQQIEMVGRSKLARWLPDESTLGPTVAITAWLHKTDRIKTGLARPTDWPVVLDRGPQAVEDYYRRKAGLWPDTAGVYGHVEIPQNSHWDPGSFDYPAFFARVRAVIEGGDDEMSVKEMREGSERFREDKPLPDDATADFRYGYNLEKRIDAATRKPEPGTPGPHEHPELAKTTHEHNIIGKAQ